MSITTELTRLTNAKAAIRSAIEGKGVSVPDSTLLDGMAALIESIEAGGGTAEPYAKIITGTHTPAINETSITFLPDETLKLRYFIMQESSYSASGSLGDTIIRRICVYRGFPNASRVFYASNGNWNMPNYLEDSSNDDIVVLPGNSSIVLSLGAGVTYNWIAVYTDT